MFSRTQRLLLRPVWPEDWRALYEAINDEGVVCNLATAPWPYREEDARLFAARVQDPRYPHFLISLPTETGQRLVGSCGLAERDGAVELGYWIRRADWGKGFATEAGRAVVEMAGVLGHRRLVASHFSDNPASGRVLRKIGFRATGVTRGRFSSARGADAPAIEFVLDLEDGRMPHTSGPAIAA